jgi:hypothetical protein
MTTNKQTVSAALTFVGLVAAACGDDGSSHRSESSAMKPDVLEEHSVVDLTSLDGISDARIELWVYEHDGIAQWHVSYGANLPREGGTTVWLGINYLTSESPFGPIDIRSHRVTDSEGQVRQAEIVWREQPTDAGAAPDDATELYDCAGAR